MIEIRNLVKQYGGRRAVDDLSFSVAPGTVTAFLGPNGAGKTTTLRMLLGLVRPTAGTATLGGRRYVELEHPARVLGASLENSAYHPSRTGRGHLRFLAAAAGVADARVEEVLAQVGLTDAARQKVGGYSLGMRQRLGLAAALLGDPEVLVLDEPANGLDPDGIRWLRGFLRAKADEGRTVLVSSHVLGEVAQTATEAVVIARGRLRAQSSIADLTRGGGEGVRVRTMHVDSLARLLADKGLTPLPDGADGLFVPGASTAEVGTVAAAGGIPVLGMTTDGPDLEAVFFELTKEDAR